MEKHKYRLVFFSLYEKSGIEKYLEKMAQKGWLIDRAGAFLWRYRAVAPAKFHISTVYLPQASQYDPKPIEEQKEMAEYCVRDGWVQAAQWGPLLIFASDQDDPMPIETEASLQVEAIHETMKRKMFPSFLLLLMLCVINLIKLGVTYSRDPIDALSSSTKLIVLLALLLLLLYVLVEMGSYFLWHRKATKAAEQGTLLETPRTWVQKFLMVLPLLLMVCAAVDNAFVRTCIIAMAPAWFLAKLIQWVTMRIFKKFGASKDTNRILSTLLAAVLFAILNIRFISTAVRVHSDDSHKPIGIYTVHGWEYDLYNDPLPLYIQDLVETEHSHWNKEADRQETIFLAYTQYEQRAYNAEGKVPELKYRIVEVKMPWLYGFCKSNLVGNGKSENKTGFYQHYVPIDPEPWDAEKAYQLYWTEDRIPQYLLCYGNKLVEINTFFEPTQKQISVIAEKLGGIPHG